MTPTDRHPIASGAADDWTPSDFILEGRFCPRDEIWSALDVARRHVGASVALLLAGDELKILTSLSAAVPKDDQRAAGFAKLLERLASGGEGKPPTGIQDYIRTAASDSCSSEERFPRTARKALKGLAGIARDGGDEATAIWLELGSDRWIPLWPSDAARAPRFNTAVVFFDPAVDYVTEMQGAVCVRADALALGLAERISATARANVRRDVLIMKRLDEHLRTFIDGEVQFDEAAKRLVVLAVDISSSDLGCCYRIKPAERSFDLVAEHMTDTAQGWVHEQALSPDALVMAAASWREHQTLGLPPGLKRLPGLTPTGRMGRTSHKSAFELATPLPGPLASPGAPAVGALSVMRLEPSRNPYGAYEIAVVRNVALRLALIATTTTTTRAAKMFVRLSLRGATLPQPSSYHQRSRNDRARPSAVPDDIDAALPAVEDALETLGEGTGSESATFRVALPDASCTADHGAALVRVAAYPAELMSVEEHRIQRADQGGINWRVALSGVHANEADVSVAEDYVIHHDGTRSQLCVPVYVEGRVIGIINLESPDLHAYDAYIDIAQATAAHVGLAVANARLALSTILQERATEVLRRAHALKVHSEHLRNNAERVDPDTAASITTISDELLRDVEHLLEPSAAPDTARPFGEYLTFPELVNRALEPVYIPERISGKAAVNVSVDLTVDGTMQWPVHPPEIAAVLLKALADVMKNAREHRKEGTSLELHVTQTRWGGETQQVLCLRSVANRVLLEPLAVNVYRCPYPAQDEEPHFGAYLAGLQARRIRGEITLVYVDDRDARVLVSVPVPGTQDARQIRRPRGSQ